MALLDLVAVKDRFLNALFPVTNTAGVLGFAELVCLIDPSTGKPVSPVPGSIGTDRSTTRADIPNLGSDFSTGVYSGYHLVKTIPLNLSRSFVDVENISGDQIVIVRDDGTAGSGALANASVIVVAGGAGAGAQGGSWTSSTFKGRLQIFAPSSTAVVSAFED